MTPPVPTIAEVDLDTAPETSPVRRRPLLAAATAVAVGALVAAAALRSGVSGPPAPPAPAVTAWVELRAVAPGAGGAAPTADLVVSVANHGLTDRVVTGTAVTGTVAAGRSAALPAPRIDPGRGTSGTPPLRLAAGRTGLLAVRQPLSCPGTTAGPLQVRVTLDTGDVVTAVGVGTLTTAGGVCAVVTAATPDGAAAPLDVRSAQFTATTARLRVARLPAGATVVAVGADGWDLRIIDGASGAAPGVPGAPGSGADDVRTLTLARPVARCDDRSRRGAVPLGLRLQVTDDGPAATRYAPVGPALARWLLDAAQGCDPTREPPRPGAAGAARSP